MSENAAELFDVRIPGRLVAFPDKARALGVILTFKITGDGGGDWTCDLTMNPPTCVRGDLGKAQCTITLSHEELISCLSDPNAGMQLYFSGRLTLSGDPEAAMKVKDLFTLGQE